MSSKVGQQKKRVVKTQRKVVAKDPIPRARKAAHKQKLMSKRQMANNVQYDAVTSGDTPGISFANSQMTYEVPMQETALSAVAASVVSFALSRGWQEYTASGSDPVQAYRWISKLLANAAQNQIPASSTGPLWLALIVQSLVQKSVPSRGGSVTYNAVLDLPDNYPAGLNAVRPIGPLPYARNINFGQKTSTLVNGYFYEIDVNIPYDETQAQKAYTSLYNFLARQNPGPMHRKVSLSDPNVMTTDASAFATPSLKAGNGDGLVGGFALTVGSEVPIRSPLFSCFRQDPGAAGDPGRAPNFVQAKGGDGYTLGGMLIQALGMDQIHFKTPIRFKAVDFLEIGEILATWVSKIQAQWLADANNNGLSPTDIQCPLTLQELLLLLRGNVMPTFGSSQHYGQSLYPRVVQSANVNEFVAYVSGFGTCAYNPPAMRLPRLLKENIQALAPKVNFGSRGGETQPVFYTTILGQYYKDELNPKDFYYVGPDGEGTKQYPSFKDPSAYDAKLKKTVSVEDPISLIDGTTSSRYVAINDPGALAKLNVLWNNWLDKVINYSVSLATNTNDGGVNALRVIGMTHHWYPNKQEDFQSLPPFYRERISSNVSITAGPYIDRRLEATTNQSKFVKGIWEGVLSKLVKPINLVSNATTYGDQTGYTAQAGFNGEFNTIVSGEGDAGGMTLAEMHEVFAASMIKGKYGAKSEIEIALDELDARGESGILSSLAGMLLGPAVGGIVDALPLP